MDVRDMARSAWTRIRSKQQIIRDFAWGEYRGKVSLLKILDITAPLIRSYEGHEVLLADTGYYWLQLAIHGSHAWFTVMFDARGKLIQIYVDVTDGNDALKDNPTFSDLYLDYVVHGSKVYELDRDELEEAHVSGKLSTAQYETALAAGERIHQALEQKKEEIQAFFERQFPLLKAELERGEPMPQDRLRMCVARRGGVDPKLDISQFSTRYRVRRMRDADADAILYFCLQNTLYYRYCGKQPARDLILQDLHVTPPGIPQDKKYYVGYYDGDVLVALLDLIDGYPEPAYAFLGFFMMDAGLQGLGLGSAIVQELFRYLKEQGFLSVRLGIDKGNPQSTHFWKKNGFQVLREVKQDGGMILLAEKRLLNQEG